MAEKAFDWAAVISVAWAVVSAILNVAFRFRTPEEWVAFGASRPRLAALVRLVRALGLDPVKALVALRALTAPRVTLIPPPPIEPVTVTVPRQSAPRLPPSGGPPDAAAALLLAVGVAALLGMSGAGLVAACTPAARRDAVDTTRDVARIACIVSHAFLPDERAVARACGLADDLLPLIRELVTAHKAGVAAARADAATGCYRDAYQDAGR